MNNSDRPAAPCKTTENTGEPYYKDVPHNGLTKREYFAGLALQGLLSKNGNATWAAEAAVNRANQLLRELGE